MLCNACSPGTLDLGSAANCELVSWLRRVHTHAVFRQASINAATCTAGSPGTMDLGPAAGCKLVSQLRRVRAAPCFSLMAALPRAVPGRSGPLGFPEPLFSNAGGGGGGGAAGNAFDAASVAGSHELAWVACDTSKPGAAPGCVSHKPKP